MDLELHDMKKADTQNAKKRNSGALMTLGFTGYLDKLIIWKLNLKNNHQYFAALIINVSANSFLIDSIPNYLFRFSLESEVQEIIQSYALSLDKFLAFFFATALSATATFIGQKYWLFKQKGSVLSKQKRKTVSRNPVSAK